MSSSSSPRHKKILPQDSPFPNQILADSLHSLPLAHARLPIDNAPSSSSDFRKNHGLPSPFRPDPISPECAAARSFHELNSAITRDAHGNEATTPSTSRRTLPRSSRSPSSPPRALEAADTTIAIAEMRRTSSCSAPTPRLAGGPPKGRHHQRSNRSSSWLRGRGTLPDPATQRRLTPHWSSRPSLPHRRRRGSPDAATSPAPSASVNHQLPPLQDVPGLLAGLVWFLCS
ncbi:pre-mRNA-splicing factor CWC22 [Triticum aestivum]|uniref:pre-mRNA-splicing factor CWC22 n=1 Tax=Triticum aestivum TaxID=4565 RepID=UPI001D0284AE|nr:pre-mRNA-splicing factor CWC22-like [Triticum aestivum]